MKPIIGSHSDNDRDSLYRFARRAEPRWYPERGMQPDAWLMIVVLVLTLGALAAVYFTGGGL